MQYVPTIFSNKTLHSQEYDVPWLENQNQKLIQLQLALAAKIGEQFFEATATLLNDLVGAHSTIIGTLNREKTHATTIAFAMNGSSTETIRFELIDSACHALLSFESCVFERNLKELYPNDVMSVTGALGGFVGISIRDKHNGPIGFVASYFKNEVANAGFVKTAFELISVRVKAEMERLLMEQSMREQQERYEFALNAGELGAYDWNIYEDRIIFSDRAYDILEYSRDEFEATFVNWVNLVHPDDYENLSVNVVRKFENGREYHSPVRYRIKTKYSGYKWIELESYSFYMDESKTRKRNIGIIKEIDQKVKDCQKLQKIQSREMALNRAIKQREEWYAFALKVGKLGVYDWYVKENRATFSQRLCEILGWEKAPDTINFALWLDAVHPDDRWQFQWKIYFEQAQADTHIVQMYRLRNASGLYRWIEAQNMAIEKDDKGHIVRMIGIIKDVHDEKESADLLRKSYENERRLNETLLQREEQINESKEKLIRQMTLLQRLNEELTESDMRWSYALEGNGDGVVEWNMVSGECNFSPRSQEILGLQLDTQEQISQFMSYVHPVSRETFLSHFELSTKPPFNPFKMEVQILDSNKNYRWILFRGKVVQLDSNTGTPVKMMGTVTDLTDQKMFQKELTIYEEMIKQNQSAILFVAIDGSIEFMNSRAIELLEYREHEILESHVHVLLGEDVNILQESFRGEIILKSKSGRLITTQVATSLLTQHGDSLGYVLNIIDITEKKQLEHEVTKLTTAKLENELESQRKQTEMIIQVQEYEKEALARELHDGIGQLLSLTRLQLEQIGTEIPDTHFEKYREVQELMKQIVTDVKGITSELMPLTIRNLGLESAIASLLEHYKKAKGATLSIQFKTSLGDYVPDQSTSIHIYRIAQEAINNAMKYSGANTLTVILVKFKNRLNLMVEDNGTGFDLDEKMSRKNSFGLKTMIARAKLVNGKLMIDSSTSTGTLINLSIPLNTQ